MKKLWLGSLLFIVTVAVGATSNNTLTNRDSTPEKYFFNPSLWQIELGPRVWFSSGVLGAPQPLYNYPGNILASRLTYQDLNAYTGEIFARAEHVSGWFAKAFLGAGGITSGNLYDEDFPAGPAYSRTLSTSSGSLSYANFDVGHQLLKTDDGSLGLFVGYNYYAQNIDTTGCAQLAGSTICTGADIPVTFPGIVEDDHFNSLRVGLGTQFMLTPHLQMSAEAAYLPLVHFYGQDDHNARMLKLPEQASAGDGMMLEALLSYKITPAWDMGVGARYWAWNTKNGGVKFEPLTSPGFSESEPARFSADRYGVFVQARYHQNDLSHTVMANGLMNWTGFSLGANLGGSWGDDQWSDPFDATSSGSYINAAEFGDTAHATGPLAGIQMNYNWQIGFWVLGVGADADWSDIQGQNTCFSGLGGINCKRTINSLGTITAQGGVTWDRSLLYLKAGKAWTNTTFTLEGNTNALSLNNGSQTVFSWGWTVGLGVAQALTNHWVTEIEYDYLGIPTNSVSFPSVSLVNNENIRISQTINLFRLVVSYKI